MSAIKNLQAVSAASAGLDDHEGQPSGEPHHSRPESLAPEGATAAPVTGAAGGSLPRSLRAAGGTAGAVLGEADPPLLTGGSLQPEKVGSVIGCSVDFLTVTVDAVEDWGLSVGSKLLEITELDEVGGSRPGFASSEKRVCPGGSVWRRYEPLQMSKALGVAYESWEASGPPSGWLALFLRGMDPVRPSRVDIAFDISVRPGLTSDAFVAMCQEVSGDRGDELLGLKLGISGQGGVNTRYIGAASSDRRIRVYRKDLQDAGYAEFFGATLRVELVLKGDEARRWWLVWDRDMIAAKRAASTIVLAMCGFQPMQGVEDLPELVTPDAATEGEQLAMFIRQHGGRIHAWEKAGVDVVDLARAVHRRPANRMAESRLKRRVEAVVKLGADQVVSMARLLLGLDRPKLRDVSLTSSDHFDIKG